jgi:hypothetical protein
MMAFSFLPLPSGPSHDGDRSRRCSNGSMRGVGFGAKKIYVTLLGNEFAIEQKRKFTEAFYEMLVVFCRKKRDHATS